MFGVFAAVKILVLFFGPMMVQRWIFTEPINKAEYVVPLRNEDNLRKTMLVKKVHIEDDSMLSNPHQQRDMKQFRKFRRLVKVIPSDEIVTVNFKKLHVLIDHHKLMSEKSVPIGVFRYIYEQFVRCGICNVEPFDSCCKESIIGTWGPKFLWFKIAEKSDCNKSCRTYLSWGRIVRCIGYFVLMAVLPLPYIIRMVFFYYNENDEIEDRTEALDNQHLYPQISHNLFQYLTPTHGAFIAVYNLYIASFLLLSVVRQCDKESCDDHIRGAVQDMRGISYLECLRMIAAHVVLPFEKFGFCGIIVAFIYWPFALPLCILVIICYSIPTLYLSGRLMFHGRPKCLQMCPRRSNSTRRETTLSSGTSSFESCFFLNNINPNGPQVESPSKKHDAGFCGVSKQSLSAATYTFLVGFLSILQLYCLLFMYAETIGFLVEGCILTLLGAIVNATSTIRYIILAFWILIYITYCYMNLYNKYAQLNRKIFNYIKDQLFDELHRCVSMRHDQHKNTAFKFLSTTQVRQKERNAKLYFDSEEDLPCVRPKEMKTIKVDKYLDTIDYEQGRLHWTVNGLILFLDKYDVPRIPRDLFHLVCQLQAPGCPGPIHKTLGRAVKQLALIIIFLLLMFIVLMIVEEVAPLSTTSELLLTLSTGLLPLLILLIFKDSTDAISLNSYSFFGKVQQVILEYKASWPVYDLSFTREYPGSSMRPSGDDDLTPPSQASTLPIRRAHDTYELSASNTAPDVVDPTHVDLLITIRDELEDYIPGNLRSEPCSLGSHGSLNSGHRHSPEDPGIGHIQSHSYHPTGADIGTMSKGCTNKPTNATASKTADLHGGGASKHPRATQSTHETPPTDAWGTGSPRVDLVVDLAKGGLQVRGQTTQTENCKNGIPMWPVSSKYTQLNEAEPEAL